MRGFVQLLPLLALGVAACHPTEALVVISTDSLSVPADFDQLQLTVGDGLFDGPLPICRDGAVSEGCHQFPLRVLLVPGHSTDTPVDVKIVGKLKGKDVLGSAARFRFTPDRTLRLDVILYADCLNQLSCLQMNQACVKNGQCADLVPTEYTPGADLPAPVPPPVAEPPDLAVAPPDFAGVDFAGCTGACPATAQCGYVCGQACGSCGGIAVCNTTSMSCDQPDLAGSGVTLSDGGTPCGPLAYPLGSNLPMPQGKGVVPCL